MLCRTWSCRTKPLLTLHPTEVCGGVHQNGGTARGSSTAPNAEGWKQKRVDKLRYTHRIENTAPQETAWINLKTGTEQKMPGTEGHRVHDSIQFKFKIRNKKNKPTELKVKRGAPSRTRKGTKRDSGALVRFYVLYVGESLCENSKSYILVYRKAHKSYTVFSKQLRLYTPVCGSIIHIGQKAEATQGSINRQMGKQCMTLCTYN